ncbi:Kynurenine formamidase [Glycine soja]|nr:Kynurenine formamidase [Glycine soja]
MEKNKIKMTGVVIMIMIRVSFSLGDYNHPFDQIGPNHVSDKLRCVDLCKIECAPLLIPPGGGLKSMKNGSRANNSNMKLGVHTGTHVDAPGHFYDNYYDAGFDVDSLDLTLLNGLALLVDVPRDKNITAEVMKSLNIPRGVSRVLFRTLNTDRQLMFKKEFDTSYVGFKEDGAKWLAENTDIKLVGIDYLSVAAYDHSIPSHLVFLESKEIILVEGLKLDDVPAGIYSLNCLPLRLVHSEASPIRCILIK